MAKRSSSPVTYLTISFDLSPQNIHGTAVTTLLKTPGAADPASLHSVQLGPYGVYVGRVQ